jgi:thiamine-phosphate pyrophosphorylase
MNTPEFFSNYQLQFITNQWSEVSVPEQVEEVCKGGGRWIQLRLKNTDPDNWQETGKEVHKICRKYGAKLIINDHVEFAFRMHADGVHLGKEDMNPRKARQILGPEKIIGGTANSAEEIIKLYYKGVDYAGLGPFRHTETKQKLAQTLGYEGIQNIIEILRDRNISLPIFAIGGIETEHIPELSETGIHGVVVSSSIANSHNIKESTKQFIRTLSQANQHVKNR